MKVFMLFIFLAMAFSATSYANSDATRKELLAYRLQALGGASDLYEEVLNHYVSELQDKKECALNMDVSRAVVRIKRLHDAIDYVSDRFKKSPRTETDLIEAMQETAAVYDQLDILYRGIIRIMIYQKTIGTPVCQLSINLPETIKEAEDNMAEAAMTDSLLD